MWLIFYDDDKTCGGAPLWIHGALNLFFLFFQKKISNWSISLHPVSNRLSLYRSRTFGL